jgi:hypothetical protein
MKKNQQEFGKHSDVVKGVIHIDMSCCGIEAFVAGIGVFSDVCVP